MAAFGEQGVRYLFDRIFGMLIVVGYLIKQFTIKFTFIGVYSFTGISIYILQVRMD